MLSLNDIIEETEVLSSEWRRILNSSEAVHGCRLASTPQHSHVEPIVPSPASPAFNTLIHRNVGVSFVCDCARPFPRKAGHTLVNSELSLLNRCPDL